MGSFRSSVVKVMVAETDSKLSIIVIEIFVFSNFCKTGLLFVIFFNKINFLSSLCKKGVFFYEQKGTHFQSRKDFWTSRSLFCQQMLTFFKMVHRNVQHFLIIHYSLTYPLQFLPWWETIWQTNTRSQIEIRIHKLHINGTHLSFQEYGEWAKLNLNISFTPSKLVISWLFSSTSTSLPQSDTKRNRSAARAELE